MQIHNIFPQTKEELSVLSNNIAIFKSELLLKSISNLNYNDNIKQKVLEKVLENLNDKSTNRFI